MFTDKQQQPEEVVKQILGPPVELDYRDPDIVNACIYIGLVTDMQFIMGELRDTPTASDDWENILTQYAEKYAQAIGCAPKPENMTVYQQVYARAVQLAQTPEQRGSYTTEYDRGKIYGALDTIVGTARQQNHQQNT